MKRSLAWLFAVTVLFMTLGGTLPARCGDSGRRIVGVGGLRTEILTIGLEERRPGEPLVIFRNGIGATLETWDAVIKEVSSFAAVLAYDRPGSGASDADDSPQTLERVSGHLRELL